MDEIDALPTSLVRLSIGTFANPDGLFCYANSTVQCLLDLIPHTTLSCLKEFKTIVGKFKSCTTQSLHALRSDVKHGCDLNRRQDPADFFYWLLKTPPYSTLYPYFQMRVEEKHICSNNICGNIINSMVSDQAYYDLQATTCNSSVQDMLVGSQEDSITDRCCVTCQSFMKQSTCIVSVSDYFVVKIHPVSNDGVIKDPTLIKGIPDCHLKIAANRFKFNCLVRHCGDLDEFSAHYVAWIKKNNKWLCASDQCVEPQRKWPTNGYDRSGKKSPYLLFYRRV